MPVMADARIALLKKAVDTQGVPDVALDAYAHEQSTWVGSSVHHDPFYHLEPNQSAPEPGSLLKDPEWSDPALFAIPPGVALSRIAYQSEDLAGRPVPATGFLLWPFTPRQTPDGRTALVVWAHGTTGMFAENAPSRMFTLGAHFIAPFSLVLAGYAVFAPDYAGLGIDKDHSGRHIVHEYLGHPAQANDICYGVQAALKAFENLSKHFVVIGHSQGGGAAWGVAQRQAHRPVDGYLGAIAVCPVTNVLELRNYDNPLISCLGALAFPSIAASDASFDPTELLTEPGRARWELYADLEGSIPLGVALLCGPEVDGLIDPKWQQHAAVRAYVLRTRAGGFPIAGPLLVVQGTEDESMPATVTDAAVNATRDVTPNADLQYVRFPGRGPDDSMYAALPLVQDWVAARFAEAGAPLLLDPSATPPFPLDRYQRTRSWYLAQPTSPWQMMCT